VADDDVEGLTPPKDLLERALKRRADQVNRIAAYDTYLAAYFQIVGGDVSGNAALANYSDGRPALRAFGENASAFASKHRASPNYIKPIVQDLVAVRGSWPTTTVPAPTGDDAARDLALLTTRALREQHEHSAMVRQQQRAGFFLSCLGDTCYTLDPRTPQMHKNEPDPFRPVGIYFNVVNPREAYPKFYQTSDLQLQDLYWIVEITQDDAREQYPTIRFSPERPPDEPITVIRYYSRTERQTVVDGQRVAGIRHNLGFCPAEWVCNQATDGRWAQSDISGCVGLHEELQDLWKVYVDTLVASAYPIIHIHDPEQTQGQVEQGPGAQFTTKGTGKIELLAPQANPQAAAMIFNSARDNLMQQTGIAPIRLEGQVDRSNVSGKSVQEQQAPMERRLKLSLDLLGQGLQRLNSKCLLMLARVPDFKDHPMELFGQDRDGPYRETFTGAQLGGWVRNVVSWADVTGPSAQERTVQGMQLFKEGMGAFPFSESLRMAGFDDPEELMQRGYAEAKERMAAMPQPQPGAGPPASGPGAGHEHFAGEHQGAPPGTPTAPPPPAPGGRAPGLGGGMPNFPPVAASPNGRGKGSPAPVPDVPGAIQQAISALQMRGTFTLEARKGTWMVDLTDMRDASQVNAAVKPIEAQFGVKIKVSVVGPVASQPE
jgi:hypothetical protein